MATTLTVDTDRAAELFHALSDKARLEVIGLLLGGEHCVCELMDHLDMGQSRLSWHLKTLSDAGIIVGRKEGRWVYYSLDMDALAEASSLLGAMRPATRRKSSGSSCC